MENWSFEAILAFTIAAFIICAAISIFMRWDEVKKILKNEYVCHNCGGRFKKRKYTLILPILWARRQSFSENFGGEIPQSFWGGLSSAGKCPHCKSRDTSRFDR